MIVALTSSKLNALIDELDIEDNMIHRYYIKDDGISFLKFVKRKMSLHAHFSDIIIDRNCLTESNDELIESIRQFRMMYDCRVTIFAEGSGNEFIVGLLRCGVYNIITAENSQLQKEELTQCLSQNGLPQIKWLRAFPNLTNPMQPKDTIHFKTERPKNRFYISFAIALTIVLLVIVILVSFRRCGADNKPDSEAQEIIQTTLDTSEKSPEPPESLKSTVSTTRTTTTEQIITSSESASVTTTTTTTRTEPSVTTTTTKKPVATTTSTTTKKPTTTTTTTTTTKPKTTTTTTATTTTTLVTAEVIPTGLKISCPVAVNGIVTLNVGGSAQLNAEFTPANVTDKSVVWNSRKPEVVTVDNNGKLTAVGKGTTTVSCETSNGRFKVAIMVTVIG